VNILALPNILEEGALSTWDDRADRALRAYLRAVIFAEPVQLALLSKYGIKLFELRALRLIRDLEPVAISQLADELGIARSTATGLIDRLEERGLVRRRSHERDRRSTTVQLTELGRQALEDRALLRESLPGKAILALAPQEQEQLAEVLEKLLQLPDEGHHELQEATEGEDGTGYHTT